MSSTSVSTAFHVLTWNDWGPTRETCRMTMAYELLLNLHTLASFAGTFYRTAIQSYCLQFLLSRSLPLPDPLERSTLLKAIGYWALSSPILQIASQAARRVTCNVTGNSLCSSCFWSSFRSTRTLLGASIPIRTLSPATRMIVSTVSPCLSARGSRAEALRLCWANFPCHQPT